MEVRALFGFLLAFSLIVLLANYVVGDVGTHYGLNADSELARFNQTTATFDLINQSAEKVRSAQITNTPVDIIIVATVSGMEALKLLYNIPNIIANIVAETLGLFGLPTAMADIVQAIVQYGLILVVMAAMISFIFRREA